MMMCFLDTNIIIRYLTNDPPDQAAIAYQIMKDLETGTRTITTCEGVIVEAVQVLSSKKLYKLSRGNVKTHLGNILSFKGLKMPNKKVYLRALDIYASTNLDFVDALNIAHMERLKLTTLVSFDRGFDRVPGVAGITRVER